MSNSCDRTSATTDHASIAAPTEPSPGPAGHVRSERVVMPSPAATEPTSEPGMPASSSPRIAGTDRACIDQPVHRRRGQPTSSVTGGESPAALLRAAFVGHYQLIERVYSVPMAVDRCRRGTHCSHQLAASEWRYRHRDRNRSSVHDCSPSPRSSLLRPPLAIRVRRSGRTRDFGREVGSCHRRT